MATAKGATTNNQSRMGCTPRKFRAFAIMRAILRCFQRLNGLPYAEARRGGVIKGKDGPAAVKRQLICVW